MRRAAKTDENHNLIVEAARATGASVAHTYQLGSGFPDVAVGVDGLTLLWEIKTEGGQLTGREAEWHATWRGHVSVIRTPEEAIAEIQRVRERTPLIAACKSALALLCVMRPDSREEREERERVVAQLRNALESH